MSTVEAVGRRRERVSPQGQGQRSLRHVLAALTDHGLPDPAIDTMVAQKPGAQFTAAE